MAFAISIKATGVDAAPILELWSRFGELETGPSMVALGYPPHITLAIYDQASERQLQGALRDVFHSRRHIRLRFLKLGCFDEPRLVCWAAPENSEPLLEVHTAIHRALGMLSCRNHYRPGNWIPHCTLATKVAPELTDAAKALVMQSLDPFEVVFAMADCIEFHPIRIIEEVPLLRA